MRWVAVVLLGCASPRTAEPPMQRAPLAQPTPRSPDAPPDIGGVIADPPRTSLADLPDGGIEEAPPDREAFHPYTCSTVCDPEEKRLVRATCPEAWYALGRQRRGATRDTAELNVNVTRAGTVEPYPGVRVRIERHWGVTDAEGMYTAKLSPGAYWLEVTHLASAGGLRCVTLEPGANDVAIELEMGQAPPNRSSCGCPFDRSGPDPRQDYPEIRRKPWDPPVTRP